MFTPSHKELLEMDWIMAEAVAAAVANAEPEEMKIARGMQIAFFGTKR